jgi:hypothetical protein
MMVLLLWGGFVGDVTKDSEGGMGMIKNRFDGIVCRIDR